MTIATLMATSAIFLVSGWTAPAFGALAITIGGVVCIASAEAGDTSQDLKTGFIVGATPQQPALCLPHRHCRLHHRHRRYPAAHEQEPAGVPRRSAGLGHQCSARRRGRCSTNPDGLDDQFPVIAADKSTAMHHKSEYIVLNALGSSELADGKYLYSPRPNASRCSGFPASAAKRLPRRRPG